MKSYYMSHHISMIVGYNFQFFTMFDGSILILHHCLMVKFHFCLNPSWFSRYNFPGGLQIKSRWDVWLQPHGGLSMHTGSKYQRSDGGGTCLVHSLWTGWFFYTLETWKSWRKHHWLVVTGTMEFDDFPFSWEFHLPNWLIFFRGVGILPTRFSFSDWFLTHNWWWGVWSHWVVPPKASSTRHGWLDGHDLVLQQPWWLGHPSLREHP